MADLSKILQQESEGIMFPFRSGVKSTTTEQQVYDSATDGIMTVTGQQYQLPTYEGPTATVQYGTEEEGYPRMLREIEQGELPQFKQEDFPKAGEGIMQPSTPVTQPVETTPTEPEAPAIDPCPPGYQLINGVCQPIERDRGEDRQEFINKPRDIGDTAQALSQVTDAIAKEGLPEYGQTANYKIDNSSILSKLGFLGKLVDDFLIKGPADKKLQTLGSTEGIDVSQNEDGTYNISINEQGKINFGNLQTQESLAGNLASTQKTDAQGNIMKAPNGQIMIQGPISLNAFGKQTDRVLTQEEIDRNRQEAERQAKLEEDRKKGLMETGVPEEGTVTRPPSLLAEDFGELNTIEGDVTKELEVKDSQTDKVVTTVNKRFLENTGTSIRLSETLNRIASEARKLANPKLRNQASANIAKLEKKANDEFITSVEEDRQKGGDNANSLTKAQKDYLDSNNRTALRGESKGNNGYTAGSKQINKTKENSGYGFKATSANFNKSTNTFDQRFK